MEVLLGLREQSEGFPRSSASLCSSSLGLMEGF